MTNGLKAMLVGLGVGLALIGLVTVMSQRSRRRFHAQENGVDDDARARMDAEGGAMKPVPTHLH